MLILDILDGIILYGFFVFGLAPQHYAYEIYSPFF